MNIILASSSPRRQELMSLMGWDFTIEPSSAPEEHISGETPEDMVCRLAESKAFEVFSRNRGSWVVGADTVVAVDGEVFGKPACADDALKMLTRLQGRSHNVITGVALFSPGGDRLVSFESTEVVFRTMTSDELAAYVSAGESSDKAGAYAIQGKGALLVERICGCYFNVVGLPLQLLSSMFSDLGWPLSAQWRK
ncbi:MAG: Maf family protein [Synergistaceae bacterium]